MKVKLNLETSKEELTLEIFIAKLDSGLPKDLTKFNAVAIPIEYIININHILVVLSNTMENIKRPIDYKILKNKIMKNFFNGKNIKKSSYGIYAVIFINEDRNH